MRKKGSRMFESMTVDRRLKGSEFRKQSLPLRRELLQAQFKLAELDYPVIILVAGIEGAGKGALIHRLNEWMDPRGIETITFWEHSDEDESHPYFWRFWRKLPPRGQIGIFLGTWYRKPADAFLKGCMKRKEFDWHCHQIESFEQMLHNDGALIIKLWLHVSHDTQRRQLEENAPEKEQIPRVAEHPDELAGSYKKRLAIAEKLILATDTESNPWHLIEAEDRHYRDITAGNIILAAMCDRASTGLPPEPPVRDMNTARPGTTAQPKALDTVDLSLVLDQDTYNRKLKKYQDRLQDLIWKAYRKKRSVVAVFEGWDAAGKGSAIRRVTGAVDPRLYRLAQFAAPSDEERAQHYLWRFWRQLERDGRCTFFDRSWYGRVLVERVEQFAAEREWQRAYNEINRFEEQLVNHGSIVLKFWIHISPEEQLSRFKERGAEPYKRYKITPEDWRNREQWPAYEDAVNEMVNRTSTSHAPWTLISGNDKPYARIQILKTFCKTIKRALDD